MSTYKPDRWSTEDEIAFCCSAFDRRGVEWLKKYRDALTGRTEWGKIDPVRLFQVIDQMMLPRAGE